MASYVALIENYPVARRVKYRNRADQPMTELVRGHIYGMLIPMASSRKDAKTQALASLAKNTEAELARSNGQAPEVLEVLRWPDEVQVAEDGPMRLEKRA